MKKDWFRQLELTKTKKNLKNRLLYDWRESNRKDEKEMNFRSGKKYFEVFFIQVGQVHIPNKKS